jgi:hypothetical protein
MACGHHSWNVRRVTFGLARFEPEDQCPEGAAAPSAHLHCDDEASPSRIGGPPSSIPLRARPNDHRSCPRAEAGRHQRKRLHSARNLLSETLVGISLTTATTCARLGGAGYACPGITGPRNRHLRLGEHRVAAAPVGWVDADPPRTFDMARQRSALRRPPLLAGCSATEASSER